MEVTNNNNDNNFNDRPHSHYNIPHHQLNTSCNTQQTHIMTSIHICMRNNYKQWHHTVYSNGSSSLTLLLVLMPHYHCHNSLTSVLSDHNLQTYVTIETRYHRDTCDLHLGVTLYPPSVAGWPEVELNPEETNTISALNSLRIGNTTLLQEIRIIIIIVIIIILLVAGYLNAARYSGSPKLETKTTKMIVTDNCYNYMYMYH